jgi:phage virion morphogenesis protein
MSGFTVTLDDAEVRGALMRALRTLTDMTPVMEDIGRALGNRTEDAFQAEGPGWPALSPVTARLRGSDHPILQDTGGLAESITHGGDRNSAWVGASKGYAAVHQFGNPANKLFGRAAAPIPARPFLPIADGELTPDAHRDIMEILTLALVKALGQGQ